MFTLIAVLGLVNFETLVDIVCAHLSCSLRYALNSQFHLAMLCPRANMCFSLLNSSLSASKYATMPARIIVMVSSLVKNLSEISAL